MTDIPVLNTERLTLRAPRMADFPAYLDFYRSDATRYTGGPYDEKQAWTLFAGDAGHWALQGFGWFILDDGTGAVGACGLHHPPHQADLEIGWNTFAAAQGKGYATEAARAVLDWAAVTHRPARLVSYIDVANVASMRVAEKLGATRERARAAHDPDALVFRHRTERQSS